MTVLGARMPMGYAECQCDGAKAYRASEEAQERKQLEDVRNNAWHQRQEEAGIPAFFIDCEHPESHQLAASVESGKPLYFWGPIGTGKTTCFCAVCQELLTDHKRVKFTSVRTILEEVQQSWQTGGNPLEQYKRVPYLFLDDIGKEQPTEFLLSKLFDLVDTRYANALSTSVTSQYRPGELVKRLAKNGDSDTAQAIVSRLRQGAIVREFAGKDRRLNG